MDNLARHYSVAVDKTVMPNLVPNTKPSFQKVRNDFIRHPQQFPIEFRRTRTWAWSAQNQNSPSGDLGLSFASRKYIPTGTRMELSIPLRGVVQKFQGTVVMVRETSEGFEIGLWLASADDASRARLVEQICHLECSLLGNKDRAEAAELGKAAPSPNRRLAS
ncbi:MAG: hypothetical protein ACI9BW_000846 [Gammaproteobacteria bacterium]|jgi:hypothetical protein